jgi:hypothetical protein
MTSRYGDPAPRFFSSCTLHSCFMHPFVLQGELQIGWRRLLRLLDEPCSRTIRCFSSMQKRTRAIRPLEICDLTSNNPPPIGLQTGVPIGQQNSTVAISMPIFLQSSGGSSPFGHSRTGSPPASVRKKYAQFVSYASIRINRKWTVYGSTREEATPEDRPAPFPPSTPATPH